MALAMLAFVAMLAVAGSSGAAETIVVGGAPTTLYVNPVTNTIFLRNSGAFASTITVLDVATRTTESVSLPANVSSAAIDLLRNRLRVTVSGGARYDVVGSDLSVEPVVAPGGFFDRDTNRYFRAQASQVDVIDADTLAVESVLYLGTSPVGGASLFDPVTRTLIVSVREPGETEDWDMMSIQRIGGSPPQVLDSLGAGSVRHFASSILAIDPYASRTYVANLPFFGPGDFGTIRRLDWDDRSSVSVDVNNLSTIALDVVGESLWLKIFPDPTTGCCDAFGRRHGGTLQGLPGGGLFLTGDFAFNAASRRLYTEQRPCCAFGDVRGFALDAAGSTILPDSSPPTGNHRVNPATSKVYGLAGGGTIVEYDEPVAVLVPMPTTITPGTPAPDGSVTVAFSATSAWAPVNHPVRRIYYQVDAIDGEWSSASPAGPSAATTLTGLSPGLHVIYAFAGDGQEEGIFGAYHTHVTGPVASTAVTIPAPPACSNGSDDDGDGLADFPADPGCRDAAGMLENPRCDDDLDNDGDGGIDWDGGASAGGADSYCTATPWRNAEQPTGCGLGGELAVVLGALLHMRRRMRLV